MLCVSSGAFLRANQTTDVPPRTRGSIPIEIKPLAAHVHGENYVVDKAGGSCGMLHLTMGNGSDGQVARS